MNGKIRPHLLFVLIALASLLTACDSILQVGVMPTSTPVPTPTPVLGTYTNEEYGFAFHYRSTWTLAEEPHVVKLSQDTLTLRIGYRWATESVDITGGRTGMPAGDFIYGGKVFFLGEVIPAQVLEYQRKDKMVLYGGTGLVEIGDLVFCILLEDLDGRKYMELDIPKELQAEVKGILESFARIEATGAPPTPTPTPPAMERASTYSNDEYGFSFQYPASWTLEEVPGELMDNGVKCADSVVLSQDTVAITIQYLHTSQCCEQVAWCGVGWILEPTDRDQVTIMGNEASRTALAHQDEVKAVDVSCVDEGADLALLIALRDSSETAFAAPEMATIPESVVIEFEQILNSFESK